MKIMGHYCRICGRTRANEKFSGKGHASHICKNCAPTLRQKHRKNKCKKSEDGKENLLVSTENKYEGIQAGNRAESEK